MENDSREAPPPRQRDAAQVEGHSVRGRRTDSAEEFATRIRDELGAEWLPRIYGEQILSLRTRSYHFEAAKSRERVEIQHTLLGVELKTGRRRVFCPDLATARYLAVFARAGCGDVAVPYDITKISHLADELESAWQRALLLVEHHANNRSQSFRSRLRSLLTGEIRREIEQAGAGTAIPQFKQDTKQRRPLRD
ncbi:MAG: hypothetical protein ACRD9R_00575 [Pyrinomonadaceae bacterium]